MKCPKCGEDIMDEKDTYCSHCSASLKDKPPKKSASPIAGGILATIAACVCGILGFLCLGFYMMDALMWWSLWQHIPFESHIAHFLKYGLTVIFVLLASVIGLAGGIAALTKRRFVLAIVGIVFIITGSLIGMWRLTLALFGPPGFILALLLGVPPIVLSTLDLIFVRASRKEFS